MLIAKHECYWLFIFIELFMYTVLCIVIVYVIGALLGKTKKLMNLNYR